VVVGIGNLPLNPESHIFVSSINGSTGSINVWQDDRVTG